MAFNSSMHIEYFKGYKFGILMDNFELQQEIGAITF